MRVFFLPEVLIYFEELAVLLYKSNYFGTEESVHKYLETLKMQILTYLPYLRKRLAPSFADKIYPDMSYVVIAMNRETQWYIFYTVEHHMGEDVYLVRYISNNHVCASYICE